MKFSNLISACAAVMIAGCAQTFEIKPLSTEEQQFEKTLRTDASNDGKLALGQMYFTTNRIDEADTLLTQVVNAEPKNAQAIAWQGANNCKIAARKGPWLAGMDKLVLVKKCLKQVDSALAMTPDDFTVQMVHMNTGAEVNMFGALQRAMETKARVEARFTSNPNALPSDALAQFYVTAARLERKSGNAKGSRSYIEKAGVLNSTPETKRSIEVEKQQQQS
jgi:tetratricopeptide (TPR) repeat protein